jgi:hypothetical protein
MKNPVPIALLALVLSLAALAGVLLDSPSGAAPDSAPPTPSAVDPQLLARLDELAADNEALRQDLGRLEMALSAQAAVERAPVGGEALSEGELEQLVEQVCGELQAQPGVGAVAPVDFTEQVASSLETIQREEATRKAEQRRASRSEKLAEQLPKAAQALGLSSDQEFDLQAAITGWYEAEAQMTQMWSEGGASEELGAFKEQSHGALESSLQAILSPQQLEDYQGLNGGVFPGAGWGGK